jgi:hypothetical protein
VSGTKKSARKGVFSPIKEEKIMTEYLMDNQNALSREVKNSRYQLGKSKSAVDWYWVWDGDEAGYWKETHRVVLWVETNEGITGLIVSASGDELMEPLVPGRFVHLGDMTDEEKRAIHFRSRKQSDISQSNAATHQFGLQCDERPDLFGFLDNIRWDTKIP